MSEEKQHKRRVHYSGKYPKKFEEKYKELNPEKYKDTIEHVISKGNTPAGMHISIMVKEIIDFLDIKPGQTGFDATLGYGGHTRAMLEKLEGQGHMFATDVDPIESEKTKKRLAEAGFGEDILTIKLQNFCTIDEIAKEVGGFDFILADLGVSSMQIEILSVVFRIRWMDRWICVLIQMPVSVRQSGLIIYPVRSFRVCSMRTQMSRIARSLQRQSQTRSGRATA